MGTFSKLKNNCLLQTVRIVPGGNEKVKKEVEKVIEQLKGKLDNSGVPKHMTLPDQGMTTEQVQSLLKSFKKSTVNYKNGKVSGTVYHGMDAIKKEASLAYSMFSDSNPLHPDVFPGIRQMEAEVVACVIKLYNGTADCCGTMSSGGTESILLACKAYRDKYNFDNPEMIVSQSAHAAFHKAASYFKIKLIQVPINKDGTVDIAKVKQSIGKNTIMIAGSAPSFPHGVIDDIEALSEIALAYKIGLHVDCCLGSFLVPFMEENGYKIPPFDFRLPGVTSISCDTHKYGFAPKGSSVIMYSSRELCHFQYHVSPDWMGGIYASPTFSGSRPGALIAGCWTTMMMMGNEGYKKSCKDIIDATKKIVKGIATIKDLFVVGDPKVSVVAFGSETVNVYVVNDIMSEKGYHLNALQNPEAVHIAVTGLTNADQFIVDLADSVLQAKTNPPKKGGMAGIYGMAASIPDKSLVEDIAKGYIDALYS